MRIIFTSKNGKPQWVDGSPITYTLWNNNVFGGKTIKGYPDVQQT